MSEENKIQKIEGKNTSKSPQEIEKINERIIDDAIAEILRHTESMSDALEIIKRLREYRTDIYRVKLSLREGLQKAYTERKIRELTELKQKIDEDKKVLYNGSVSDVYFKQISVRNICQEAMNNNEYPLTVLFRKIRENENRKWVMAINDGKTGYELKEYGKKGFRWAITRSSLKLFDVISSGSTFEQDIYTLNTKQVELLENGKLTCARNTDEKNLLSDVMQEEKKAIKKANIMRAEQIFHYYENEIECWRDFLLKRNIEETDKEQVFE